MSFPFPRHRRKVSGDLAPHSARFSLTLSLPSPPFLDTDSLRRLAKVLVNVTIENSLGPVQVLISPDDTVADLIKTALALYEREKRRPFLKLKDPKHYALHYSPFWLQSLKGSDKLRDLGSRNFFLYTSKSSTICSCSEEANMNIFSVYMTNIGQRKVPPDRSSDSSGSDRKRRRLRTRHKSSWMTAW